MIQTNKMKGRRSEIATKFYVILLHTYKLNAKPFGLNTKSKLSGIFLWYSNFSSDEGILYLSQNILH
jgi:hypothetical protein